MKRASYRHGIEIIAMNDEPTCSNVETVSSQITVALLADLFGKPVTQVAQDVMKFRQKHTPEWIETGEPS